MTFRVIQAHYLRVVKGIDVRDPEKMEVEKTIKEGREGKGAT